MSRTNDIAFSRQLNFIHQMSGKYSKKEIENFFGIKIKEVDESNCLYNVYVNGELVFPNIYEWTVGEIFASITNNLMTKLCEEAEHECDLEKTNKMAAEFEAKELENEKENYYTCPICHSFVKKGTHFHLRT